MSLGKPKLGKWCLVLSSCGYAVVNEVGILKGPTDKGANVDYHDPMGVRISGVIIDIDKSKSNMMSEMERLSGIANGDNSDTVRII